MNDLIGMANAFDDLCTKYLELRDLDVDLFTGLEVANEKLKTELEYWKSAALRPCTELENILKDVHKAQREELDTLDVKLNAFREENSKLGDENQELYRINAELKIERDRFENAYHGEIGNHSKTCAARNVLERKFAQLNSEHEGLRVSYEEARHNAEYYFGRAKELCASNEKLDAERDALRTENSELRAKLDGHSYERDYFQLAAKYDALSAKYQKLLGHFNAIHNTVVSDLA